MNEIDLGCFGIIITVHEPGVASIVDGLGGRGSWRDMVDAITSLILAHHCAGIDVTSPAYLEGIETAVENISNMVHEDED
jgi:hypothetical protein